MASEDNNLLDLHCPEFHCLSQHYSAHLLNAQHNSGTDKAVGIPTALAKELVAVNQMV